MRAGSRAARKARRLVHQCVGDHVANHQVAILDPELTYTIPLRQTAYSAADIVSHLLEAYVGHSVDWAPYQDHYCQASIRTIIECMDRLLVDPADKQARACPKSFSSRRFRQASTRLCAFES